jgi:hypothetical protein
MPRQPPLVPAVRVEIVENDLELPLRQADTTSSMKARNSLRRRRFLCATFTLPVATSKAANSVVVPCRL